MNDRAPSIGTLLRDWRQSRRLSQFDLAFEAGISARHLSFIETGKSQPSREVVRRLATVLGMPLRERNALLVTAGFAPDYHETPLTTTVMEPMRRAIEFIIEQQEPYPALVLNRHWDILMTNRALERVVHLLHGRAPRHTNVMRQVFDPADLRSMITNWEELAGSLVGHLHDDVAAAPADVKAKALLDEILSFPGVPVQWHTRDVSTAPVPLLTTTFGKGDVELRFFSTFTTFGAPRDVTLDELRIECLFPADDATAALCRELASRDERSPALNTGE